MTVFHAKVHIQRGGSQYRQERERYFFIKHLGWFVHIRGELEISEGMECSDGILGPFSSRARAKFHLLKVIYEEHPELFEKNASLS